MKIINYTIEKSKVISGIIKITPSISSDSRGIIYSSYHDEEIKHIISSFNDEEIKHLVSKDLIFKHDKFSTSSKGVLRGIHGDSKTWKLISCVYGNIYQVVVDRRKNSPTFNMWESFNMNYMSPFMLLLPPDIGNSFLVLSDVAIYHYKLAYIGDYLDALDQFSIKWNDSSIGIDWPISNPILSDRDK